MGARRVFALRHAFLVLAAMLLLSGCQSPAEDDPLVIRDDDALKEFMFPRSKRMVWTYRRATVGLVEDAATVSFSVESLNSESAKLTYALEGADEAEIVQGIGLRGDAEISLRPDGTIFLKDRLGELTYHPDGLVTSKDGSVFELLGTEKVTTPAGTFACVKYGMRRSPSADFPMIVEGTLWWGKGAGLVKAVSAVEGYNAGVRTTVELVDLER